MKVTSSLANKLLKQLNEEKDYWLNKEKESMLYTATADEDPVIPEYDYEGVSATLDEIDRKICKIKHAINTSNINSEIEVAGEKYTVDMLLVRMSQLTKRKLTLDKMRKQLPKSRVEDSGYFSAKRSVVEYRYTNYDVEKVKRDFEEVSKTLFEMQMKLDVHNQTVQFDVDIEE
ncbi:MAG: hypothetical protein IJ757_00495 [Clostridiales bacterium]|nr:hypothetical protein [Clostridiales bacterium]